MDGNQPKTWISTWVEMIHDWAHKQGFYGDEECYRKGITDPNVTSTEHPSSKTCNHRSGSVLAQLMLVVTELAEAAEAKRKGDAENFREEIADTVIRLFDLAGACGMNLEEEISKKMSKNFSRPYRHEKIC